MSDDLVTARIAIATLMGFQSAYSGVVNLARRAGVSEEEIAGIEAAAIQMLSETVRADIRTPADEEIARRSVLDLNAAFVNTRRLRKRQR